MATVASVMRGLLSRPPRNGRYYAVAIDGRGGSGKSTLAGAVQDHLNGWTVIAGDGYFEPLSDGERTISPSGFTIWGGFNDRRFQEDVLNRVVRGEPPALQPYSYAHQAYETPSVLRVESGIVIERCFTFAMPVEWDARIWVETPRDVCLARALVREELPREQVRAVWEEVWQVEEDAYITATHPSGMADCIVDGRLPVLDQL